jgi:hypothetical protein
MASVFARILDAPTVILQAKLVRAGGDGSLIEKDFPEHCRVIGNIAATVGFLLRMPTATWNKKLMMGGCGGFCGDFLTDRIDPAFVRGYAVVVTDMGHKGGGWEFAYNNVQGQIDFGYRSTHVTIVAAKVVAAAFYRQLPEHVYFWGCSTGGRQGMVEAERFPHDFDAIAAGAPPWSQTGYQPYVPQWQMRSNTGPDGKAILSPSKLPLIHDAVLAKCDARDGLKDNILEDPKGCDWTPQEIVCKTGQDAAKCLTPAEAEVVQNYYDGPHNSKGEKLFFGQSRGSELKWPLGTFSDATTENTTLNYVSFCPAPGPEYTGKQFDYDRDPERMAMNDWFYKHDDPDLRAFKAAGGKLILYQGWDDGIPAAAAVAYYDLATKTMGGSAETRDFFRMFLVPGMDHCRYGIGGGEVDWVGALEDWVEKGKAPDQVIAHHMKQEPYPGMNRPVDDPAEQLVRMARYPLDPTLYDRARPVYAYPGVAHYNGTGDPALPDSWHMVMP